MKIMNRKLLFYHIFMILCLCVSYKHICIFLGSSGVDTDNYKKANMNMTYQFNLLT